MTVNQEGFRWRNDDGSETTATWRQSQDTDDLVNVDEVVRLRFVLDATAEHGATTFTLEYKEDDGDDGDWRPIGIGAYGDTPTIVAFGSNNLVDNDPTVTFTDYVPQEDDLVLLYVASTTTLALGTPPMDWTVVNAGASGIVNTDDHGVTGAWHLVTSAEETADVSTFTATDLVADAETGNVLGVVIRGADPDDPIISSGSSSGSGNAVTPHILASLTDEEQPPLSGGLLVRFVAKDSTGSYTTPSGHTLVVTSNVNQASWLGTRDAATVAFVDVSSTSITPDTGDEYASITTAVRPARITAAIAPALSSNVINGAATTAQLASPAGKTGTDFQAGEITESSATSETIDLVGTNYTEVEWVLAPQDPASAGQVYDLRVVDEAGALAVYLATPEMTIGGQLEVDGSTAVIDFVGNAGVVEVGEITVDGAVGIVEFIGVSGVFGVIEVDGAVGVVEFVGVSGTIETEGVAIAGAVGVIGVVGVAGSILEGSGWNICVDIGAPVFVERIPGGPTFVTRVPGEPTFNC